MHEKEDPICIIIQAKIPLLLAAASLAYLYLGDSSAHEAAAERQMMRRHEMWFPHHPPCRPPCNSRRKRML